MRQIIALVAFLLAGLALGAAGDAIYRVNESKEITPAEALCYATCAKNQGVWTGLAADMRNITVHRSPVDSQKFSVRVIGVKRAPLSTISSPDGVVVEGVEE